VRPSEEKLLELLKYIKNRTGILSIKNNAPSEVGPYQLSLYSQNNNYLILLSKFDIDGEHIVRTSVNQEALDGYVDIFGEMHSATNCNRRLRSRN